MESSTPDEKEFEQNGPTHSHLENYSENGKTESTKWGARQTIAIVSLSILWVGKSNNFGNILELC